jgi:hypothetical protein
MRKLTAAVMAAAVTMQFAAPAFARDFFNRTTMLGWRQQTGAAVVAYFRAPLGPSVFKAPIRTGLALTGPRSYNAGEAPLYSTGPKLVDFAFTKRGVDARWIAQLNVGNTVAWTNAPKSVAPNQLNLAESGMSWVAVGAIAAGLAAGTVAFIEKDKDEPAAP